MNTSFENINFKAGYTEGQRAVALREGIADVERRRQYPKRGDAETFSAISIFKGLQKCIEVYGWDIDYSNNGTAKNDAELIFDAVQGYVSGAIFALCDCD